MRRMAWCRPLTVRSAAFRRSAFSLEKAFSIGLKSRDYGGRNNSLAPAASMASRTGWLLWLDRVSMTTMSPGASAGTRTCLTYSRKPSPLMEPSRSWVAVTPLSRSPATSVVFLRCPCGTAARRRTPLGARPRGRAPPPRRPAVQASHVRGGKALVDEHELRRIEIELGFEPVLTSPHHVGAVLLGSVQRLLFEGQAAAIEEGPDRAGAGPHAFLLDEPALQFFDGGVRCGLDHRQQEVAMGVELGAGPASLAACRTLAAVAQTLNPLDRRRNADVEANRGLARRRPVSRGLNHSVPQILTVRSRHACFASTQMMRAAPLLPSSGNPIRN